MQKDAKMPNPKLQNNHINSEMFQIVENGFYIYNNLNFDDFDLRLPTSHHFTFPPQIDFHIHLFIPNQNSNTPIHTSINSTQYNENPFNLFEINFSSHHQTFYP